MSLSERRAAYRVSTGRAGSVSQRFADERLDRFVRSRARPIGVAILVVIVGAAAVWLLVPERGSADGLAAGFVLGTGLASLYCWCVLASGAGTAVMGKAAEEWTDAELRGLRRKGWKHLSNVVVRGYHGDVDHIAVGPDGVLVIETKWRSLAVDVDDPDQWLADAIRTTRRRRDDVRMFLNWRERDDPAIAGLLVMWGPDVTHESEEAARAQGINIVAGKRLQEGLTYLGEERLSAEEIDDVYSRLLDQLQKADERELAAAPDRPPSLRERANIWVRRVILGWAGLLASLLTLRLPSFWPLVAIVALAALGGVMAKRTSIRDEARSFTVGVLAVIPLGLMVLLAELL